MKEGGYMDENNNNENQGNEVIKDTAKSLGKALLKPIKKWILIGTLCLFGFLLVVGLLHLVEYQVKSMFTNLVNTFSINSAEDAEPVSSETNDSVIYIDKNGKYKLKENYSELILQRLEEQKVNNNVMGFNLDDEDEQEMLKDMIDTYIKAEVATTFPNTGDSFWEVITRKTNDVEGNITIKRAKTSTANGVVTGEGTSAENLEYVKYSEFCSWIESGNTNVLNYFSINPENFKLCIANREAKTVYYNVDASGNATQVDETGGKLTKEELDYRTYLENYAVPLNYLMTMHLISQDVDFMKELVELATGAEKIEPLVLTYVDSEQQFITEYSYQGEAIETIESIYEVEGEASSGGTLTENSVKGLGVGDILSRTQINNDNSSEYYGDAVLYEKQVTTTYSGKLYITKTDTWLKTTERSVTRLPDETISTGPIQNTLQIEPRNYTYTIKPTKKTQEDENDITEGEEDSTPILTKIMSTVETINMTEYESSSSTTREFSIVDTKSEIIVDEFLDLIEKYPGVKNKLSTAPSNIFYLLQQNENTQKLEKIMRYVLYELNDVDYGVRLEDLDFLLAEETFISASGGIYSGGSVEETIWFTLLSNGYSKASAAGVLGNIWMESGFRTNNLEDAYEIGGSHSLGHTDKSYTDAVNSGEYSRQSFISDHVNADCGAGYGLLQWTWGTRKAALYDLAKSSGRNIDDVNVQVEYLLKELSGIKQDSVWRTTEDPYEAGEVFCKGFVNPGASSSNVATRANKSKEFYEQLKDKTVGTFDTSTGGTLYTGTYTSTRGRTFTILNQNTIPGWGAKCNRAAAAIIASGYTNQDASTLINTMNAKYAEAGDTIVPRNNFFNLYGLQLTAEYGGMGVSQYSDTLRNQLQSGGYAMVWLSNGPYYGASGTKWTGQIHWVAILDYKNEGGNEQILIADWRGAGWYSIGEFKNGISKIALINEM